MCISKIIGMYRDLSWSNDLTIRISSRPGRNQTTRIHNEMDWAQRRARQQAQQRYSSTQLDVPVPGCQE